MLTLVEAHSCAGFGLTSDLLLWSGKAAAGTSVDPLYRIARKTSSASCRDGPVGVLMVISCCTNLTELRLKRLGTFSDLSPMAFACRYTFLWARRHQVVVALLRKRIENE